MSGEGKGKERGLKGLWGLLLNLSKNLVCLLVHVLNEKFLALQLHLLMAPIDRGRNLFAQAKPTESMRICLATPTHSPLMTANPYEQHGSMCKCQHMHIIIKTNMAKIL